MNLAQVWWWRYRPPQGRLCSHSETCFALPSSSSVRCFWRCLLQWLIRATRTNHNPLFLHPKSINLCCLLLLLFVCVFFFFFFLLFLAFWIVVRFRSSHQVTNHTTYPLSTDQSHIRLHKCMYSKECKDNNNKNSLNLVLKKPKKNLTNKYNC